MDVTARRQVALRGKRKWPLERGAGTRQRQTRVEVDCTDHVTTTRSIVRVPAADQRNRHDIERQIVFARRNMSSATSSRTTSAHQLRRDASPPPLARERVVGESVRRGRSRPRRPPRRLHLPRSVPRRHVPRRHVRGRTRSARAVWRRHRWVSLFHRRELVEPVPVGAQSVEVVRTRRRDCPRRERPRRDSTGRTGGFCATLQCGATSAWCAWGCFASRGLCS